MKKKTDFSSCSPPKRNPRRARNRRSSSPGSVSAQCDEGAASKSTASSNQVAGARASPASAADAQTRPFTSAEVEEAMLLRPRISKKDKASITCCSFGTDRLDVYKFGWFCFKCDDLENFPIHQQQQKKGLKKYKCEAEHHHYTLPQQKMPCSILRTAVKMPDSPSETVLQQIIEGENSDDESPSVDGTSDAEPPPTPICTSKKRDWPTIISGRNAYQRVVNELNAGNSKIRQMEQQIVGLKAKVISEQKSTSRYRRLYFDSRQSTPSVHGNAKATNKTSKPSSQRQQLRQALFSALRDKHNRLGAKTKAEILLDVVFDVDFLDGIIHKEIIIAARGFFRDNVYCPETILEHMDERGGTLNFAGIEILRTVEKSFFLNYYSSNNSRFQSILPSKSALVETAKLVEECAKDIVPIDLFHTDEGEGIAFRNIPAVMDLLIKAYGLEEAAKVRPVEFSTGVDAAPITKSMGVITMGMVPTDIAAIDPRTKIPLCLSTMQEITESKFKSLAIRDILQSPLHVYPLSMMVGGETKKNMDRLQSVYSIVTDFESDASTVNKEYKPLAINHKADMSAQWKLAKKGGGMKKSSEYKFCLCCPCFSNRAHKARAKPCEDCTKVGSECKCYHHVFVQDAELEAYKREIDEIVRLMGASFTAPPLKICDLEMLQDGRADDGTSDPKSIWYEPLTTSDKMAFSKRLNNDLRLRDMSTLGNIEDRRERLFERMQIELDFELLKGSIAHCSKHANAFVDVAKLIPCILHLEMRCGLKHLQMILGNGLARHETQSEQLKYMTSVEEVMNKEVLGTALAPHHWSFPKELKGEKGSKKYVVGDLRLTNSKVRLSMERVNNIINVCLASPDGKAERNKHKDCMSHYRFAMNVLVAPRDYTELELQCFADESHLYIQKWIGLYGKDGMSNYNHVFSCGHLLKYMRKYKCLHRFSQQGWEHWNAAVTSFFFKRTQRGGNVSTGIERSKLWPLARWLQRRLMWISGDAAALFKERREEKAAKRKSPFSPKETPSAKAAPNTAALRRRPRARLAVTRSVTTSYHAGGAPRVTVYEAGRHSQPVRDAAQDTNRLNVNLSNALAEEYLPYLTHD